MPNKRLSMRKIREVLRLHFDHGLSANIISRACGIARSTCQGYIKRFKASGVAWPLPELLDDTDLDAHLFSLPPNEERKKPLPDWRLVHKDLSRKGVTLKLLWQEYRDIHPDGYGYTQFTERYRQWSGRLDVTMRQTHKAGEKLFVDYGGMTMDIVDARTGEVAGAQIFVATLGASNFIYAEASADQSLESWIGGHTRALQAIGGVPEIVVPDNLKAGVKSPCRYDTSPRSIQRTRNGPSTITLPLSRPGSENPGTRPRRRSPSKSLSVGFWLRCATADSSPCPNLTKPSEPSFRNSTPGS